MKLEKGTELTVIMSPDGWNNVGVVIQEIKGDIVKLSDYDYEHIKYSCNINDIIEEEHFFSVDDGYSVNMTDEITIHTKYSINKNAIKIIEAISENIR